MHLKPPIPRMNSPNKIESVPIRPHDVVRLFFVPKSNEEEIQ